MDTNQKIPIKSWGQVYSEEDRLIPVFYLDLSIPVMNSLRQSPQSISYTVEIGGTDGLYDGFHTVVFDETTRIAFPKCLDRPTELAGFVMDAPFTLYPRSTNHWWFRFISM